MTNSSKRKNVIDFYKYWTNEGIKTDLDKKRFPFAILCCNLKGDFNVSCLIRSSNAFVAEKVFIYGNRQWDRRGAVGAHQYQHVVHIPEGRLADIPNDFTWVGIDNLPNASPIQNFVWPKRPLLCFGEEEFGLSADVLEKCQSLVYIEQYGSVRSLNVAVAGGIAMHDFIVKHRNLG